ncbi:Mitochondrial ribosomal protein [Colletotrichum higginsianum IMI 349063]|uniref:Large ribosomal subunit protein mL43 n=5 Tax=Colletotrichum destructivum species complex TaxID=2707350 RepID=A0A1B7YNN5_COLHI|nr:Mitochondrial ribosomal protein [Colletotrichum higginsianum IMI 349063]OBR13675.1 Mitochondrial ribosomal protein [Colletotrichum higginsianum IMI 349063]GJC95659.1 mitochondrial ribosomal protein [Colletotrichum higginsianum]
MPAAGTFAIFALRNFPSVLEQELLATKTINRILYATQGTMTIQALKTVSTGRNGLGAFILQCRKMDFHYCDWAGSSKGMNGFIKSQLPKFAAANPQIEFTVSPRPSKHPIIVGHYINGREKAICVRNMEPLEILKKAELLRDASGEKLKRVTKPVASINPSVRGIWSPYHGKGMTV